MSRNSAKSARGSAKTARRVTRKSAKSARGRVKKASKTARRPAERPAAKSARPSRVVTVRSPSVAPKSLPSMLHTFSPSVQPGTAPEISLKPHKYHVGETVYYTSPTFGRTSASGSYTVVKQLPSEGDDYQYRIKSSGEAFERVAKESQLDRV